MEQPEKIGRYEIERELGKGGMGQVYLGFDPELRRRVAIKVLSVPGDPSPQFQTRFKREAKILASLEHPHIVPIYDYGYYEDRPYLVMRYLAGGTLAERIEGKPLPLEFVGDVLESVAAALDFSHHHEGGIVHRDIKPGNILFDDAGRAYISDYGLSYLLEGSSRISTTTGQFVGTPSYASPEQCQGLDADRRSDVYSLGIMLYEMLTGTLPYPDASPVAVLLMHIQAPPPDLQRRRPDLPPACAQVVAKALAKDPAERFGSAGELRQAWQTALAQDQAVVVTPAVQGAAAEAGVQEKAPSEALGEAPALPRRSPWLRRAIWLLPVLVLAAGLAYLAWGYFAPRPAPGMTGEFNIAVAEFAVVQGDGASARSQDGRSLGEFLFQRLQASFEQLGLTDIRTEVWGPQQTGLVSGDTPEARALAAADLAQRIGADILIYGVITAGDSPQFQPEFYVDSRGFQQAAEITGRHNLGSALRLDLPFELQSMQSVENPALSARASALSLIAIGMAYQSVDNYEQALQFFQRAEETPGWLDSAGKEVIYLLLGNAFARQASLQKSAQPLEAAAQAYEKALALNSQYARAQVGLASVIYLQALGDPNNPALDTIDTTRLQKAQDLFQQAPTLKDAPESAQISVKVHFGLGQVYLMRDQVDGGGWIEQARGEFEVVTQTYEAGNQAISDLAAQAYARLALIAALQNDLSGAVENYQKAIAIASPYYQAYYNARLGEAYSAGGQAEQAIGAYEEAVRIAEFYGYAESANQYAARLKELRSGAP